MKPYYKKTLTGEAQLHCNRTAKNNSVEGSHSPLQDRIQFLDLTVHRKKHNMTISTYRKPTETDTTIHYLSNHSPEQKMAAYRYHINRLNTLPIKKEEKEKEWDNVGRIAMNNGFPKESIKKVRKKLEQKRIGTNDKMQEKQKWTPFRYFSPLVRSHQYIQRHRHKNSL